MSDDGRTTPDGSLAHDASHDAGGGAGPAAAVDTEAEQAVPWSPPPPPTRGLRGLVARFPGTSGYLLRSLLLAASTILIVSLIAGVMTLWSVVADTQRYRESDGYRITGGENPADWSDVVGFSATDSWIAMAAGLGGFLPWAVALALVIVQPAMEVSRRWIRSPGVRALLGLLPVAVLGIVVSALTGASLASYGPAGGLSFWALVGTTVAIAIAYGTPILVITALVIGLSVLAERRRFRPVLLGLAIITTTVLVVAAVVGSMSAYRVSSTQPITDGAPAASESPFTRELAQLDGVAGVELLGPGLTITIASDADEADIVTVATAAQDRRAQQEDIVLVVLQRETARGAAVATEDPAAAPWRLQVVPSEFPTGSLPTQVHRILAAEALGVTVVQTGVRPSITVASIAALPDAVRSLAEIYPDGAFISVPERFSMVQDPAELSPAMVDAILAVVVANPDAEFEVTELPKLYVNHVTPEAAAAIELLLQDPALAGTSPSGYPAEYQIRTSGPDGEVFLEGVFG